MFTLTELLVEGPTLGSLDKCSRLSAERQKQKLALVVLAAKAKMNGEAREQSRLKEQAGASSPLVMKATVRWEYSELVFNEFLATTKAKNVSESTLEQSGGTVSTGVINRKKPSEPKKASEDKAKVFSLKTSAKKAKAKADSKTKPKKSSTVK